MSSRKRKLEISFALFVQSATWSIIASFPEKSAQLSPWGDDWEWHFRTTTTARPRWNKYISSTSASDPMLWLLIIGGVVLAVVLVLIKYLCKCDDSDTEDSSATLHPPPVRIVPPPDRSTQSFGSPNTRSSGTFATATNYSFSTQNYTGVSTGVSSTQNYTGVSTAVPITQNHTDVSAFLASIRNYAGLSTEVSSAQNASDKPPSYFAVVSDSGKGKTKFPEVAPKLLDTPPPKYED